MSAAGAPRFVVVGGGPAGRAAMAELPGAVLIARPEATAWHAEPGLLWVEAAGRVRAEPFDALLVCADEPLLLAALGCAVSCGRIQLDAEGRTSVPGVSAAGRVAGAADAAEAGRQGRAAARALRADPPPPARTASDAAPSARTRLDPVALAALLERPGGPARDAEALAQHANLGAVIPARPVGLAALAALAGAMPDALPPQRDEGGLA